MFSFRSNTHYFQVVSFILAAVCFAALFLCWQTPAVGQNARGKKTTVATDTRNNSADQEKDTVKNVEKTTTPDKDKQANSNGQGKATKTAAKGTQNNNNVKSTQEIKPFWEKAWDDIKTITSNQNETTVTTNVGKNTVSQKKESVKKAEKKLSPDKNKQANSNGQGKTTKTAAKGTQNNNNVKSTQEIKPFWEKAWDDIKTIASNHWNLICLATVIINLIICLWSYSFLIPSQRRKSIENDLKRLEDFKKIASECMQLRYSNNETTDSQTTDSIKDLIKYNKAKSIIDNVFQKHFEEYKPQKKTIWYHIRSYLSRSEYIPISLEDAYLVILLIWDNDHEAEFNTYIDNHKKAICDIFEKRYRAYLWDRFKNISLWSLFIFIFPLLTKIYDVWNYFNS